MSKCNILYDAKTYFYIKLTQHTIEYTHVPVVSKSLEQLIVNKET